MVIAQAMKQYRAEMGLEEGILFQEYVNYVPDGVLKQSGYVWGWHATILT